MDGSYWKWRWRKWGSRESGSRDVGSRKRGRSQSDILLYRYNKVGVFEFWYFSYKKHNLKKIKKVEMGIG